MFFSSPITESLRQETLSLANNSSEQEHLSFRSDSCPFPETVTVRLERREDGGLRVFVP